MGSKAGSSVQFAARLDEALLKFRENVPDAM